MDNINLNKISDLIAAKEFNAAKEALIEFLKEDEFNIEALKLLGLCNVNLQMFKEGQIAFETVVKYAPDDASSWFYLANCCENLEDFLHAKTAYLEVIRLRDNYIEAYKSLCIVYMKSGEPGKAIEYGARALQHTKEDYQIYFLMGTAHMSMQNMRGSVEYLEQALRLKSDHSQIYNNLGTAYLALGDYVKAFENYEHAVKYDPNNSVTYFNMASIMQLQHKHHEACFFFKKAYEIEASDSYLVSLALSEFKAGLYKDAAQNYRILIAKYPEKSNFYYNLACCLEQLREFIPALEILERLTAQNPKSIMIAQKLIQLYLRAEQPERAKNVYERLISKGTVSSEIYYDYAMVCMQTKDYDGAERILKKVLELKPDDALTRKDLGVIYLNKRLFDYAKDEFEKALLLMPGNPEIIFELANFYHATEDFVNADINYAIAVEKSGENPEVLTFCAKNKLAMNDPAAALFYLNKALQKGYENEFVFSLAGRASFLLGDYENAKFFLVRAFEINKNLETENMLGLCYFNLAQFEQANNIFLNLLEKNPKNTNLLLNSARCCEQLGENAKAVEQAEKAVEIFPDFEEAHEIIRRLA